MKNHYVDNKATYESLCVWKEALKNNPDPDVRIPVPDMVAIAIVKISENLSRRYNFSGYTVTWKEEMIGDAIEHCLRYIKNFNTEMYKNPHAYITRICFNAFVQRIKKERKETAVKYKVFLCDSSNYSETEDVDYEFFQQMLDRVNAYESGKAPKPAPEEIKEPLNLEKFYD